jgi:uncharacterized protein (DUF1330 family)
MWKPAHVVSRTPGDPSVSAYLVGHVTVKDPGRWQQYVAGVARSLEPYGGEVVFRGRRASLLAGAHGHDRAVVIRFADHAALLRWFGSPAYQALVPLRDAAADVVLVGYEET